MSWGPRTVECPCGVTLQPLDPTTSWPAKALEAAMATEWVPGSMDMLAMATIAHWMMIHPETELYDYLRSY